MAVVAGITRHRLAPDVGEARARRALRAQIARMDGDLADALVAGFPHTEVDVRVSRPARGGPRLLSVGELEAQRDALHARLREARARLEERGREEEHARALLERMLLDPGGHRHVRIRNADVGGRGCGVWHVRPRLGLIGMLADWWDVRLSSGCPRAT
jgi:fructose-1,6-bisphosphatase/sedoheptulose 1,7-bisphosphatase-like protein